MVLVLRVGQGGQEVLVAAGAADVVGRAGVLAVQADGELQIAVLGQGGFDDNAVLPLRPRSRTRR